MIKNPVYDEGGGTKADCGKGLPPAVRTPVSSLVDIVNLRQQGRAMALRLGFTGGEVTLVSAAISEVAREIVEHAHRGVVLLHPIRQQKKNGMLIIARDQGPALVGGSQPIPSVTGKMKAGLPCAKFLMDDFAIISKPGQATTVAMTKWVPDQLAAENIGN